MALLPSRNQPDPAIMAEILRRIATNDAGSGNLGMPGRVSPNAPALAALGEPPPPAPPPAISAMETAAAEMNPANTLPDYRTATSIDNPDYPTRAAALPNLTTGRTMAPVDSTVMAPGGGFESGPGRVMRVDLHEVKRKPGESDQAWKSRQAAEYRDTLKDSNPYSKVTKTATGVDEAPPQKPGLRGKLGAGARMAGRIMGAGQPYGAGGMVGSSIAGLLTGIFAPGYEAKVSRQEQIAQSDIEANAEAKRTAQEQEAKLREAQVADVQGLPQRRADAQKELERDNLRNTWQRIVSSGLAFDKDNPDHAKLQQRAAELGEFLPFTPAKPTKAGAVPKTGLANATTVADAQGNKIYVDKTTLQPIADPSDPTGNTPLYADRRLDTPDTAGENKNIELEATRAKERQLEAQARANAERIGKEATSTEAELKTAEQSAASVNLSNPDSLMSAGDKAKLERVKELKGKLSKLRTEESEAWDKRAQHDIAAQSTPTLKTKPSRTGTTATGGAYAGQTFPKSAVQAWADAHKVPFAKAQKIFEDEGAKVQ